MPEIDVRGTRIHYEEAGAGPPLLLIMGLGTPKIGWSAQIPAFAARYRTIAFDNRGSGRSAAPPGPYAIADLAADALGLLDALDVRRAHVAGVSMGGMIAQEIAAEAPERVGALVVASSYAAPGPSIFALADRLREKARGPAAFGMLAEVAFSPGWVEREGARLFAAMAEAMPNGFSLGGVRAQSAATLVFDVRSRLGKVRAPALVLTGDADQLIAPEHSDEIASLVRGARLARIPGGSHAVNFERGDEWNALVLPFLAEHDGLLA
jgi:pimeloyl-ACP methyl ester carboxylesterase